MTLGLDQIEPSSSRLSGVPGNFVPFEKREIEQSIPDRFRAQVVQGSERIAVRSAGRDITYAELDRWSDAIAEHVLAALVGARAQAVPFLLPQGPLAIATTLGILKAGSFYVPLDPSWGCDRARELCREIGARVVLADAAFARALGVKVDAAPVLELPDEPLAAQGPAPRVAIAPDDAAYVYFTSGSTGRPKGVVDCHRNVLHNVLRYTNALSIGSSDRLTLLQSCGFSGAVSSMFAALLNGACSCPLDMRTETPASLRDAIDRLGITIWHSVPSIFRGLAAPGRVFHSVRVVRLEGDRATRLDLELFRAHFAPPCVLAVGLGATETGLVCQHFFDHERPLPQGVVPIGYPVTDMRFEVRDAQGRPMPTGQTGEIVVLGRYLATGYWNDSAATARAFGPASPADGERSYRTGDLGRVAIGGCLEHLGRLDGRARVRGQWVDLADIEAALGALPDVREAAVAVVGEDTGDARLTACYTVSHRPGPTASALRRELATRLPPHMVPTTFVELDDLPLNAYGKVDRRALPSASAARPRLDSTLVAPRNLVEQRLVELWEATLGVHPVGVLDDFFDLGGDSLAAVTMLDQVGAIFERQVSTATLLERPTIIGLAAALLSDTPSLTAPVVALRTQGSLSPFFFLHGDYLSGGFYCRELAKHLHADRPLYVLPPAGVDGAMLPDSYVAMAAEHLIAIRSIQPSGPYFLGGECNGGLVAYEIARRLASEGERVALLVLLSASADNLRFARLASWVQGAGKVFGLSAAKRRHVFVRLHSFLRNLPARSLGGVVRGLWVKRNVIAGEALRLTRAEGLVVSAGPTAGNHEGERLRVGLRAHYQYIDRAYLPRRYSGRVILVLGRDEPVVADEELRLWRQVASDVDLMQVPGDRTTKLTRHVGALADVLDQLLARTLHEPSIDSGSGARTEVAGQHRC